MCRAGSQSNVDWKDSDLFIQSNTFRNYSLEYYRQLDLVPVPKHDATKAYELVKLELYAFLAQLWM